MAAIAAAVIVGAAVAVAVVLLLTGRIGNLGGTTPAARPTPTSIATSGLLPTTVAPTSTPDPAAGAVLIDAATDGRFGTDAAQFATPSRNIACVMSTGEVRCDVLERTWQLPPAPADCQQAFGTGAILAGTGAGQLSCVGDTVADPGLAVLAYGEAVRFGGVVCVSRETGLRCENPATRHGFSVARASYELF